MNFSSRSNTNEQRQTLVRAALLCGLVFAASPRPTHAQFGHSDVDFGIDASRLVTDKNVYEANFPTFGITKQFSSNPGFAAETDGLGTIGGAHEVFYHVLDDLTLWDGAGFVELGPETHIRIENNPPGSTATTVNSESGEQLGSVAPAINRIGVGSETGEVHSHVNYFLEQTEDTPPQGAYGLKLSIGIEPDSIADSDPFYIVFNYGLEPSLFDQSLEVFAELLHPSSVVGDFDDSGVLDIPDIDLLTVAVASGSTDLQFDLNGDELIDQEDRVRWVEDLFGSYFGDSNLDGEFNSTDFVAVFQIGEYEDDEPSNSTWSEGDWDGDGDFTSSDFVLAFQAGGYEQGPRSTIASAVPESTSLFPLGLLMLLGLQKRRRLLDW